MSWFQRGALLALFVIGAGLGVVAAAYAYPIVGTTCGYPLPELKYWFADNGARAWENDEKNAFREGGDKWEAVQKVLGGSFVIVREVSDDPSVLWAKLVDLDPDHAKGVFTCAGFKMDIWEENYEEISFYQQMGLATHEIGHSIDLRHPGTTDSFGVVDGTLPDEQPSMATCIGDYAENISLAQDDYASLGYHYTIDEEAHANTSFENGGAYWGYSGGAWGTAMPSGGNDGPSYLLLQGPEGGSAYQTVRVTDPSRFRARVNFRKHYSMSTGYIFVGIYARKVTYVPVLPPPACESGSGVNFPNDWDLNKPTVPNHTYVLTSAGVYLNPTTTWQWLPETGWWTPDSTYQGVDLRIRIYNYMTLEGAGTPVRIDHARAYSED